MLGLMHIKYESVNSVGMMELMDSISWHKFNTGKDK